MGGTIDGKPRGWCKFILAIDCETTGLAFRSDDPSYNSQTGEEYQAISFGLIVLDSETLSAVDQMYLEVQWNEKSVWSSEAEKVHGLSRSYLREHGFTETEACEAIGSLIVKYWGSDNPIMLLGHNVHFDKCFLQRLFRKHGIELIFGNRHIDTSTLGFVCWNVFNSDDLFQQLGVETRNKHNALDDIKMSVEVVRTTRKVFERCLDGG